MSDQILDGKNHKNPESGTRKWKTGVYKWVIPELTDGTHAVTGGRVREGRPSQV